VNDVFTVVLMGIGMLLIVLSLWFWLAYWRRGFVALDSRPLLWLVVVCGPLGFVALQSGWVVTEVGRQPWVINGVMRTSAGVTPAEGVAGMFFLFSALYLLLGGTVLWLLWNLPRVKKQGGGNVA
jgi:cytochrome bd ubiquinol oxidase subunit I